MPKAKPKKPDPKRAAANLRAQRLLFRYLTPTQIYDAKHNNWFYERGHRTGRIYRIHMGKFLANIVDPRTRMKYCICIPERHEYPTCDHILAQVMLLRYNEERFLRTANVTVY